MAVKKLDWYLALYVGDDLNAAIGRMWDMQRYDRCYPASNAERFEKMGFILLKQPHQQDIRGGFTFGRWRSFGFTVLEEASVVQGDMVPPELEGRCRRFAAQRKSPELYDQPIPHSAR